MTTHTGTYLLVLLLVALPWAPPAAAGDLPRTPEVKRIYLPISVPLPAFNEEVRAVCDREIEVHTSEDAVRDRKEPASVMIKMSVSKRGHLRAHFKVECPMSYLGLEEYGVSTNRHHVREFDTIELPSDAFTEVHRSGETLTVRTDGRWIPPDDVMESILPRGGIEVRLRAKILERRRFVSRLLGRADKYRVQIQSFVDGHLIQESAMESHLSRSLVLKDD